MQDLVTLGTGNSRLMKSNIPSSTTLAQLISMLNSGTFPYDTGPLNSAGISQQGTALNKANLLTDPTAALFGLGADAVPDDVFQAINEMKATVQYGSYTGSGTYGESNPCSITFNFSPKVVFIFTWNALQSSSYDNGYVGFIGCYIKGFTNMWDLEGNPRRAEATRPGLQNTVSANGNTISWYSTLSRFAQFNISGIDYNYVGIS